MIYAIIENGICVDVVMGDEEFAKLLNLVEVPDGFGIGDYYIDGVWSHELNPTPEPPPEESVVTWSAMAASIKEGVDDV